MAAFDRNRALKLLCAGVGDPHAGFRPGQEGAIEHVVTGAGRLLVVQKTGWGKSFVYFIATRMLREAQLGPTLLVSPLLALMRNQIAAAGRMGVNAETINSDNPDNWYGIEQALRRDEVDILLIAPERLANDRFRNGILADIADRIALLVIDEAHCISDWGHDFRPHYRLIERTIRLLPPNLRLLATTATANDRVTEDLGDILGPDLTISRGDLHRPSLALQTIRLPSQAERLAWLADQLPKLAGSGIVYTLTVRDAEQVAAWLKSQGINAEAYTSETGKGREELEQALLENRVKALVATTALGMGYDKPDLAFVIHYQTPGSAVAYYQQVGRAGRALNAAYGVLLSGYEETDITDHFIRTAFPSRADVREVVAALESEPAGLSVRQIQARVNISFGRIDKALQLLSLESPAPVVKDGPKWQLTAATLADAFWERADRLTALRRVEQAQMQEYVGLRSGHMEFLIRSLDGDPEGLSAPDLPDLPTSLVPERVREAVTFLRRSHRPIEPRKAWPTGKRIDKDELAQPGMALSVWGDAGWGEDVHRGKYQDGRFSDALVEASASAVREWQQEPSPAWVTAIPSRRHASLVPDFARRLAFALGLPYVDALAKKQDRPEQKDMQNSDQQARNVIGSLAVNRNAILPTPVLLVDDMVDSRWTFTVAARLLRLSGSGVVWPFALADTAGTR
ncbi:MAG: RecQ family ATP-dependent DNA helicase [Gammaproteobacteria bacterium]|nr:RecQ family ATP-dependent DNA helicase [Gammaproteobacteria bacterium]MYF27449.1 RecQ family ATP-dependent DNA helicase [Gammaproteobacteria bacterium]MYK45672.1 RecQ family ATP-dependent DNA helicase [Gammaproteobacteria bacterium]